MMESSSINNEPSKDDKDADTKTSLVCLYGLSLKKLFSHDRKSHELNTGPLNKIAKETNVSVLEPAITCYIEALNDMINVIECTLRKEVVERKTFIWFAPIRQNNENGIRYEYTTIDKLISDINKLLQSLKPLVKKIAQFLPNHNRRLWYCVSSFMKIKKKDNSLVFDILTSLIEYSDSAFLVNFHPMLKKCINQEIQILFSSGRMKGKDHFCKFLSAIVGNTKKSFFKDIPFLTSLCTTLHRYFRLLPDDLEKAIVDFTDEILRNLSNNDQIPLVDLDAFPIVNISLIMNVIQFIIRQELMTTVANQPDVQTLYVTSVNNTWMKISTKFMEMIDNRELKNEDESIPFFKFIRYVIRLAGDVNRYMEYNGNTTVIFFRNNYLWIIIQKLLKILLKTTVNCERLFRLLLKITKEILLLPEFENLTKDQKYKLIIVLNLPWPSILNDDFKDAIFELSSLREICNQYIIDEKTENMCLSYSSYINGSSVPCWSFIAILEKAINGGKCKDLLGRLISFVFYNISDLELNEIFRYLISHVNDIEAHVIISEKIRKIICILAGRCAFVRYGYMHDGNIVCVDCDYKIECKRKRKSRLNLIEMNIEEYLIKLLNLNNNVILGNIIDCIPFIFKHTMKENYAKFIKELLTKSINSYSFINTNLPNILPNLIFTHEEILSSKNNLNVKNDNGLEIFEQVIEKLTWLLKNCINNEDYETQAAIMIAVCQIGKIKVEGTLLTCCKLLMSAQSCYSSECRAHLKQLAQAHGLTEEKLYYKFREEILVVVIHGLVFKKEKYNANLRDSFQLIDGKRLFLDDLYMRNHLVKLILPKAVKEPDLMPFIAEIAVESGVSVKELLTKSFRHIYVRAVIFEDKEVWEDVCKLLVEHIGHPLHLLLDNNYVKVLSLLICHLNINKEKSLSAIVNLPLLSNKRRVLLGNDEIENARLIIDEHSFGVLMELERHLSSPTGPQLFNLNILLSMGILFEILQAPIITPLAFKILNILGTALADQNNRYEAMQALKAFLMWTDARSLGVLLSTTVVMLLPFLEDYPELIGSIIDFLVVQKESNVSNHICELYFLQQNQCSIDAYEKIKKYTAETLEQSTYDRLRWTLKQARHEKVQLRLYAFNRLHKELEECKLSETHNYENGLIPEIIDVLMEGIRNGDELIREASGKCFGEIGAIDPSYLPNMIIQNELIKNFPYNVNELNFVGKSLFTLCYGYQSVKKSFHIDQFALAIQVILKEYSVTADCPIWNCMPKFYQELMLPFCTTSLFTQPATLEKLSQFHPLYSHIEDKELRSWVNVWALYLENLLPIDSKERRVYLNCRGAIKCNTECLKFFLPHLLLQAIMCSNAEAHMRIYEEMNCVLNYNDETYGENEYEMSNLEVTVLDGENEQIICKKMVFNLLDCLFKAIRIYKYNLKTPCVGLQDLLKRFRKDELAMKSVQCKEYTRALLYLEEYVQECPEQSRTECKNKYFPLFLEIYRHLHNVDNLRTIFAQNNNPIPPQHNAVFYEVTDRFEDAVMYYNLALEKENNENVRLSYERRMVECYLSINDTYSALRFTRQLAAARSKMANLSDLEAECLWNLSKFDELETLLKTKACAQNNKRWGIQFGRSIDYLLRRNLDKFDCEIGKSRQLITSLLHVHTVTSAGYKESYENFISKLHILNEVEKISKLLSPLNEGEWKINFNKICSEFGERLKKLQPIGKIVQPVLTVRYILLKHISNVVSANLKESVDKEVNNICIQRLQMSRRCCNLRLAHSYIATIENEPIKEFFIEKAKYHWVKLEKDEAINTLQRGLGRYFSSKYPKKEDLFIKSKVLLLLGKYNDQISRIDFESNVGNFKEAAKVANEKTFFHLANYLDKNLKTLKSQALLDGNVEVIKYYSMSLKCGCKYIYQSMYRMLTLWFDYNETFEIASTNHDAKKTTDRRKLVNPPPTLNIKMFVNSMNLLIDDALKELPSYYFLTAFSQIVSYLSTTNETTDECFEVLKRIITTCIKDFPEQTLWRISSLYRTAIPNKKKRDLPGPSSGVHLAKLYSILRSNELLNLSDLIRKFKEIFETLSRVCECQKSGNNTGSKTTLTGLISHDSMRNLLLTNYFNCIMIPLQKYFNVTLANSNGPPNRTYNPFPTEIVTIYKIRDEIFIYRTLECPKRVDLVGSDGRTYQILLKKDEVYLDYRAMEFNTIVNTYLKRDSEARDRSLRIRTYSVVQLLGNTGLLEFIPDLVSLKYATTLTNEKKPLQPNFANESRLDEKRKIFLYHVSHNPSMLQEWFKLEFPNPSSWYAARSCYVRTLAVMSIVGYVIGLGDRHGDNILLDTANGEIMHVDLSRLVNTGELLGTPEIVPFRLTHSMVEAMGVTGVEGMFKRSCEITNRVLRSRKDQLVSVLRPFIHYKMPSINNEPPEHRLKDIELRLEGVVRTFNTTRRRALHSESLSVEGQTEALIKEATSVDNLCKMYEGWGPQI